LPYGRLAQRGVKLAMAVGGQRAVSSLSREHWRSAARAVELPGDLAIQRIVEIAERMPAAIDRVIAHSDGNEATRAIMARLSEPIGEHVKRCLRRL